ncbi:hypothetical protein IMZ11_02825 [Microtetraspora sp. AC03309]|uniref:hypothetical protein n=1 Tax=Microtetraspora sp. AC03309 TaxID=2779376 RepID=UPI001E59479F|nr:hypothetical protein [Microtetraspora sp. AC03309]MCC5574574.1 hypothetical protein [Microtetraspora sp. AC03309]
MPRPLSNQSDALDALIERALSYTRRLGDGALAQIVAAIHNGPPESLLIALRSPAGTPRIVALQVGGLDVTVEVNPNGRIDYDAEQRAWDCIQNVVLGQAA